MKKLLTATIAVAVVVPVGIGEAHTVKPTAKHVRQYTHLYQSVQKKFGARTPGRQILKWGLASGRKATDGDLVKSIAVLDRMLAPPPVVVSHTTAVTATGTVATTASTTPSGSATIMSAPSGSLMSCIISHESGGNPQATNGQYGGIGQWSAAAWAQDGGTKYASSPTGASYAQQQQVLASEGSAGMAQQQGQYDGCTG